MLGLSQGTWAYEWIMEQCSRGNLKGYIAFHSLSMIWYFARKLSENIRRRWLLRICRILTVSSTEHQSVVNVIKNEAFQDFEDCLQELCASNVLCDDVITCNI